MSYDVGIKALNMQWTERVARTEYIGNEEIGRYFARKYPGKPLEEVLHLDYMWTTNDGLSDWSKGRTTDMGHAIYKEDGSDYRLPRESPFNTADDVLNFHCVKEYGLPDFKELVDYYDAFYRKAQSEHDLVVSGGYYKTIVSAAIQAFGWEMLLLGAGEDPDRFGEDVLGSIFEFSLHHFKAWAQTWKSVV